VCSAAKVISQLHFQNIIACYRPNGNYCRFCCEDI